MMSFRFCRCGTLSLVLLQILGSAGAFAAGDDPLQPHPVTAEESVTAGYIVELKEPPLGLRQLDDRRTLTARTQLARVHSEQAALRRELSQLGIARRVTGGAKTVANALFISSLTDEERLRLETLGYRLSPNRVIRTLIDESVPGIQGDQAREVRDSSGQRLTGRGVRVAVIDTGLDYTRPDFGGCSQEMLVAGRCARVPGGYDLFDDRRDVMDVQYHGTAVASVIGGNGPKVGVAPEVSFYPFRVCSSSGRCPYDKVIRAVEMAVDPNGDGDPSDRLEVINISLGGGGNPDDPLSRAVDIAVRTGAVVVSAAGNSGPFGTSIECPGCARLGLAVGAVYKRDYTGEFFLWDLDPKRDQIAAFSSRGPVRWMDGKALLAKPDLVAPGAFICGAASSVGGAVMSCDDRSYFSLPGTSFSAPHVAGVAALIRQKNPHWTPLEVNSALRLTASPLVDPTSGRPYEVRDVGSGKVNAHQAVLFPERPPVAALFVPPDVKEDVIDVRGIASGSRFESFEITLHRVDSGESFSLFRGSSPVEGGSFGMVPLRDYPDGVYRLILVVRAGEREVSFQTPLNVRGFELSEPPEETIPVRDSYGLLWAHYYGSKVLYHPRSPIEIRARIRVGLPYTVEWCTDRCSSEGVTLTSPKVDRVQGVAYWQVPERITASTARPSKVTIRITVESPKGRTQRSGALFIDPSLVTDFAPGVPPPIEVGAEFHDHFTVADLDDDGKKEIIVGQGDVVSVVDIAGIPYRGWPQHVSLGSACGGNGAGILGAPVVGNVHGDLRKEVVVVDSCGAVHAYTGTGTRLGNFPRQLPLFQSNGRIRYALGDIDRDSWDDIITADEGGHVTVLNGRGQVLPGWPRTIRLRTPNSRTGCGRRVLSLWARSDADRGELSSDLCHPGQ